MDAPRWRSCRSVPRLAPLAQAFRLRLSRSRLHRPRRLPTADVANTGRINQNRQPAGFDCERKPRDAPLFFGNVGFFRWRVKAYRPKDNIPTGQEPHGIVRTRKTEPSGGLYVSPTHGISLRFRNPLPKRRNRRRIRKAPHAAHPPARVGSPRLAEGRHARSRPNRRPCAPPSCSARAKSSSPRGAGSASFRRRGAPPRRLAPGRELRTNHAGPERDDREAARYRERSPPDGGNRIKDRPTTVDRSVPARPDSHARARVRTCRRRRE